jgi:hypothetical protein
MHHLVSIMVMHCIICTISVVHGVLHPHVAPSSQSYISTVHHVHGYIPSIALWIGASYHYPLIASASIGMFYNQYHLNHSDNKLWARMFQTSLINLSYYLHLLSISFLMNITDIYRPHVVISCCDLNSWKTWSPFSLFSHQTHPYTIYPRFRYTYLLIFQRLLFLLYDCFLLLLMDDLLFFP